ETWLANFRAGAFSNRSQLVPVVESYQNFVRQLPALRDKLRAGRSGLPSMPEQLFRPRTEALHFAAGIAGAKSMLASQQRRAAKRAA
ncbi:unnamed protein product, partial [Amoebophrya sp. A25]